MPRQDPQYLETVSLTNKTEDQAARIAELEARVKELEEMLMLGVVAIQKASPYSSAWAKDARALLNKWHTANSNPELRLF